MSWTDNGSLGSAQNKTAANNITFTTAYALAVGDVVTVQVATDNAANTTGATTTHTSVTLGSNTFTKVAERTIGGGGVASGVTLSLWRSQITSAVASGSTTTANFNFSPAAKAFSARAFTPTPGSTIAYSAAQVDNTTGAPVALTVSGLTASDNHLAQRSAAVESSSASITTQTTNWTLGADIGTTGGSSATNVSTRSEYLISTGATSYTSQPTGTSADGASIMFVISETPPPRKPSSYGALIGV